MALLVGQRHQDHPAHPGLEVLHRHPGQRQVRQEGVDHRLDRLDAVVQAGALGQVGGVVAGVLRGVLAGHATRRPPGPGPSASTAIAATTAESMPPERPSTTDGKPFLSDVVAQAQHQRLPHLGLVGDRLGDPAVGAPGRRRRGVASARPADARRGDRRIAVGGALASVARRPARRAGAAARTSCTSRCSTNCGARASSVAVRGHDHRVAVEDQLVLAADHVDVRDGGARLGGPAAHQRQPHVVLVQLVRRAVDVDHQADAGLPGHRERAAGLPQVLADGQRHVHPADPHHGQRVARARSSGPRRRRRSWAGGA